MALLVLGDLWHAIEPLMSPKLPKSKGGRPRATDRAVLGGILVDASRWNERIILERLAQT